MKTYYEEPSWLKGSIYEILQDRGDYSIFLKGVDMCDYTALLKGKSILTVMAPADSSFRAYLKENYQVESIEELPLAEVKKLIGFHVLYYSFDKSKLVNFRPNEGDGATEDDLNQSAGLYYKFRTRSQDAPEQVLAHRIMNTSTNTIEYDTLGQTIDVYHLERFLPVFSYRMFDTKAIDAKYNYEYFFTDTEWKGDDGFNVSNAEVTEYEAIAKNGYVYFVDRVVKPLETIHTELVHNGDYSKFLSLYDQYDYYVADDELTNSYGGGYTTYYQHNYRGTSFALANIDSEWPVSQYAAMDILSSISYSIFAPTDAAFDEFYRSYWGLDGTGYPAEVSYDSISSDAIGYLLSNCIYASSIVFPEQITKGEIINSMTGTVIDFPVDDVPAENRKMCVNGALYGCSTLTPPAVFGSVTGPAYQYKRYSNYLMMLASSGLNSTLCSDAINYITLYPSNAQFEANGITYDAATNKLKKGTSNLGSSAQQAYVYGHVVALDGAMEGLPDLNKDYKVYRTLSPNYKLYWYVHDGKITNSFKYSSLIQYAGNNPTKESVYTDFKELTFRNEAWSNGHCYEYDADNEKFLLDGDFDNATYAKFVQLIYAHRNDEGTLFQGFIQMLMLADLIDAQSSAMTMMNEDCLMLVPTTNAVKQAVLAGSFPYVTTTSTSVDDPTFFANCSVAEGHLADLQHYMLEYFLPESTAPFANYPYLGWGEDIERDGGIPTIADVETTPATSVNVFIYDRGLKMTAKVQGMETEIDFLGTYDYLPFVFDDGCVQFIDGIFENKWPL